MPHTDASRLAFTRAPSGAVRFHVHHLSDSLGRYDLEAIDAKLRADPAFAAEGHCAETLTKFPDLRVVLVSMRQGAHLGDASAFARLTVQALRGHAAPPPRRGDAAPPGGLPGDAGPRHDARPGGAWRTAASSSRSPGRARRRPPSPDRPGRGAPRG